MPQIEWWGKLFFIFLYQITMPFYATLKLLWYKKLFCTIKNNGPASILLKKVKIMQKYNKLTKIYACLNKITSSLKSL